MINAKVFEELNRIISISHFMDQVMVFDIMESCYELILLHHRLMILSCVEIHPMADYIRQETLHAFNTTQIVDQL